MCGDINAHSLLWDDSMASKRTDKRGRIVEEWLADSNMLPLNDGTPTHTNRSSGTESAPDVTLVHSTLMDKTTWERVEDLSSDHHPIIITYRDNIPRVNDKPAYKWKLKEANWDSYRKEIEKSIPLHYGRKNINKVEKKLRKIIIKSANKHITKKKVTVNNKCYLTDEIKKEIKKRNKLRRTLAINREEWIAACRKVAEMIKSEKESRWREYVSELSKKSDAREIFRTVRAIDGKIAPRKENEVLEIDGKAYISDKHKAEKFAKTYRSFSKLPTRKEDRKIKKVIRRQYHARRVLEESEQDITKGEMMRAIREASNNRAAGRDDIPYEMIKNLGPKAQDMLLDIYRRCWRGEGIPSKWRTAAIITLLKEGKDPKDPTSYRPISLTPCLGKILEKIIANRLIHILEDRGVLTENQAGFRPGRCTTDQVIKLVQEASDNMHSAPSGRRTVVTFFDYNKAYDMVWRDGLLYKMIKMNIPHRFVKYVRHFLSGRKTVVNINHTNSKEFLLKEGLPQGSSISPLLFLIFINDIDVDLDVETAASLFADDTSTWRSDGKIRGSNRRLIQAEVDKIIEWARVWKMKINASKTKSMVIASSTQDQKWDPTLKAGDKPIKLEQEYKFLGINISADLRFSGHVETTIAKCRKRNKVLKCMSTKNWGNSLETQRTIYVQYIRPALEYASPSWTPWISETNMKNLQRVQNDALRSVAGLTATCPVDFLHLETNVEPLKDRFRKNNLLLREKYKRLPIKDPRRKMLDKESKIRLKTRQGWRHQVKENELPYDVEELKPPLAPWRLTKLRFDEVKLEKSKDQYTKEELKKVTDDKVAEIEAEAVIFTDGSTSGRQERGGAGVYIIDRRTGKEIKDCAPAGAICSSYAAEGVAFLKALEWLRENPRATTTICTDSLSLQKALANDDWKDSQDWIRKIKETCHRIQGEVTVLWIPSHCGCEGNEEADRLAEEGTKKEQSGVPITHAIAQARIKNSKWAVEHQRAQEVYREKRKPKFKAEKSWSRRVRSLYARLRTGHAKQLKQYRYQIDADDDPYCVCGEEEDIRHILCECPILDKVRREIMQEPVEMHHLVTEPEKCRLILATKINELKENMNIGEPENVGRLRRQRGPDAPT